MPRFLMKTRTWVVGSFLFLLGVYGWTLAQTPVLGDPTEYTFVASILGIAHPPGYALMTLLGKLFQELVAVGEVAWRMHLLSAVVAVMGAMAVYGTVRAGTSSLNAHYLPHFHLSILASLFAAFTVGTATNQWQHAIHANPHILTATFLAINLFLLNRWWATGSHSSSPYLYLFCLSAGLGVTHHPLTVFGFPAYAIFILWNRPRIWREGWTLVKMVGCALLGLAVWLYFPIRSSMQPLFGSQEMDSWQGFWQVVLAQGLRVNLFFFGWEDQPNRALVFWSLLRLQYTLPTIFLAVAGVVWGGRKTRSLILLLVLVFLGHYLFVINSVQDVMAYLLGPFLVVGICAGIGLFHLLLFIQQRVRFPTWQPLWLLATVFGFMGPLLQLVRNAPHISLRDYDEGVRYVQAVEEQFAGTAQVAVLLNDWEHMTPLWYRQFVEQRQFDPADVRLQFVSTARPWVESVFDFLSGGKVFLSGYRPEVVAAGFRLRPVGHFYQVVEPGDQTIPPELTPLQSPTEPMQFVAYDLPQREATAGDYLPLSLAMQTTITTTEYYVPVLQLGELKFPSTTDSHLITPLWQANEVIIERFDFALPHDLATGSYELTVAWQNLSAGTPPSLPISLGAISVTAQPYPIATRHLLANFRQRVGLVGATVRNGLDFRRAAWSTPLPAQPGDQLQIVLQWEALALAEESYTVFLHLIDAQDRPLVTLDYTPLGGASPTHLWIPKWLPGQRFLDPYHLEIPMNLSSGDYRIEVGLYEMVGKRRLLMADRAGNFIGDRYILGTVTVQP